MSECLRHLHFFHLLFHLLLLTPSFLFPLFIHYCSSIPYKSSRNIFMSHSLSVSFLSVYFKCFPSCYHFHYISSLTTLFMLCLSLFSSNSAFYSSSFVPIPFSPGVPFVPVLFVPICFVPCPFYQFLCSISFCTGSFLPFPFVPGSFIPIPFPTSFCSNSFCSGSFYFNFSLFPLLSSTSLHSSFHFSPSLHNFIS